MENINPLDTQDDYKLNLKETAPINKKKTLKKIIIIKKKRNPDGSIERVRSVIERPNLHKHIRPRSQLSRNKADPNANYSKEVVSEFKREASQQLREIQSDFKLRSESETSFQNKDDELRVILEHKEKIKLLRTNLDIIHKQK